MYKFYTLKLTFTSDSLYNNNFIIIYNNINNNITIFAYIILSKL